MYEYEGGEVEVVPETYWALFVVVTCFESLIFLGGKYS